MGDNIDVSQLIVDRIESTRASRKETRTSLDNLSSKIASCAARMGKRPRESLEQLDEQLAALERNHSTTTQTSQDERQFMRDMQTFRTKKKEIEVYEVQKAELDDLKAQRNTLSDSLRHIDSVLDELYTSQRRMRAAGKVGCEISGLSEKKITIPEESRPHVIGKAGASIRQIESQCEVSIDIERSGGSVLLTGSPTGIEEAEKLIQVIVDTVSLELELSPATLLVLMHNKAERAQALQSKFSVRLDISRANKSCKITGLSRDLQAARAELEAMDCVSERLQLDASVIPVLIGKAGSNIQKLQTDFGVSVALEREDEAVTVSGLRDDVTKAVAYLKAFLDENRDVEVRLTIERPIMSASIIGQGGKILRSLQNEYAGVYFKVHALALPDEATPEADKTDKKKRAKNAAEDLVIRGRSAVVLRVKARVESMINAHRQSSEVIPITAEVRAALLGKGGNRVKELRDAHPQATIEVMETDLAVVIHSTDVSVRQAVKAAVMEVVAANVVKNVPLPKSATISLKSARFASVRTDLDKLGLTFTIETENELVKLCGSKGAILKGEKVLATLVTMAAEVEMGFAAEDLNALTEGGDSSFVRSTETDLGIEMQVVRKANLLILRGEAEKLVQAEAAIKAFLHGDEGGATLLFPISDKAIGGFLGKAGANVNRLQQRGDVKVDILRSAGKVRIRAPDAATAAECKREALQVLDGVRVRTVLDYVPSAAAVSKATDIFFVDVIVDKDGGSGKVAVVGAEGAVVGAVSFLAEATSGRADMLIPIPEKHCAQLRADDSALRSILQDHAEDTDMYIKLESGGVRVRGPSEHAGRVKLDIYRMLDVNFPDEFAFVPMDRACISEYDVPSRRAEILATAGASGAVAMHADPQLSCMRVMGDAEGVAIAVENLRSARSSWLTKHAKVSIEAFMIPLIVGSKGSGIDALQKAAGVRLKIDRNASKIVLTASDEAQLTTAKEVVEARLAGIKRTNWMMELESLELCQRLIGKAGATIKKLRADTKASISLEPKTKVLTITGADSSIVEAAKTAVMAIVDEFSASNHTEVRCIELDAVPTVIGKGGVSIQEVQATYSVRVDVNRKAYPPQLTIKGSATACASAIEAIDGTLEGAGYAPLAPVVVRAKPAPSSPPKEDDVEVDTAAVAVASASLEPRVPVGASASMAKQANYNNMSASAQRRARRKERDALKKQAEGMVRPVGEDAEDLDHSFEIGEAAEFEPHASPSKVNVGVIGSPRAAVETVDASTINLLLPATGVAGGVHSGTGAVTGGADVGDEREGVVLTSSGYLKTSEFDTKVVNSEPTDGYFVSKSSGVRIRL